MRSILHCDLNNFYASVECLERPELKDGYVAVCGSQEDRHGIVLAKNERAKKAGVKTGMVIWEAKRLCPELVIIEPDMAKYLEYSKKVRKIYAEYTDLIEPFGIDEAWLDVTASSKIFGTAFNIAETLRKRVKEEIGLTISVGVSFNKVFAKLASDMKKPDATTVIDVNDFKKIVYPLPVNDMIYVGKSSTKKLNSIGIKTIGDIASSDVKSLTALLGKWGEYLYDYATGNDNSPVINAELEGEIKSVSNSTTCYRDLINDEEVKTVFYAMAESVFERAKAYGLGKFKVVSIFIKDSKLIGLIRQKTLAKPSILVETMCKTAMELFKENYTWENPVRTVGIGISHFTDEPLQMDMFTDDKAEKKKEKLQNCVSEINKKYGKSSIERGIMLTDKHLTK